MGDLKTFVKKVVEEMISKDYTYLKQPPCRLAIVKDVKKRGDLYVHVIRLLDKQGNEDAGVPEIPDVISDTMYQPGERVVVLCVEGVVQVHISGRWYK